MSELVKHAKFITTTKQPDGSEMVTVESYYEKLAHSTVEMEKIYHTTRQDLLKDLIECTILVSEGSPKVSITIEPGDHGNIKLTKRWTLSKKNYNRQ